MSFMSRPPAFASVGSSGSVSNPIGVTSLEDVRVSPTNATCNVAFGTDGALTALGNASIVASNWYSPTTAAVGDGYWVRCSKTAGTNNTSGSALATWLQLSSARSWTWTRTDSGTTSATITLELATDSGGSNVVATKAGIPVSATVEV